MNSPLPKTEKTYYFDEIAVDGENFRVVKRGRALTLTPRAFDVLVFLLGRHGRTVEKQEIFENVWKESFVSDNALTKIVREIRHALEDSAEKPRYIETVPKRGYRFIGELRPPLDEPVAEKNNPAEQPVGAAESKRTPRFVFPTVARLALAAGAVFILGLFGWLAMRQKPVESSPSPIRSLAVLPFQPLNADSRDESLEMGMAETLITRLGNLDQLVVRPVSAVRKFTDPQLDPVSAGRELQAEAVIDGSIQKAGDRVRVTVRLTDVRFGTTLWAEKFDENFTDIFKLQDSIAERIATALTLRLSRREKELLAKHSTNDPEAYQLYLRGQLLWHGRRPNWIEQSLDYYRQALEKDPNFALAHIGTADCYIMLSGHHRMPMAEAEAKARPAILRALEIDDELALAHNAHAELKYQFENDWPAAEREFRKAIELNPNIAWIRQANGWFLMSQGRFDEAAAEMTKAQELDPSSLTINAGRGRLYYYSRQYDRAIRQFQNILAVEPADFSAYRALYTIYEQSKRYPEAFETFLKMQELNGLPAEKSRELREVFKAGGWPGFQRRRLETMKRLEAKGFRPSPAGFAEVYVQLGDRDQAFAWLEKVFEAGHPSTLQFKVEPAYDVLRGDPRYAAFVRKIGLEP